MSQYKNITEDVSVEVFRLLDEEGYTQRAAADKLGLSRGTVQNLVRERAGRAPWGVVGGLRQDRRGGESPFGLWQSCMRSKGLLP